VTELALHVSLIGLLLRQHEIACICIESDMHANGIGSQLLILWLSGGGL
jgi:N-acetylglutamate synthase-like GNAT family acetyltransferase